MSYSFFIFSKKHKRAVYLLLVAKMFLSISLTMAMIGGFQIIKPSEGNLLSPRAITPRLQPFQRKILKQTENKRIIIIPYFFENNQQFIVLNGDNSPIHISLRPIEVVNEDVIKVRLTDEVQDIMGASFENLINITRGKGDVYGSFYAGQLVRKDSTLSRQYKIYRVSGLDVNKNSLKRDLSIDDVLAQFIMSEVRQTKSTIAIKKFVEKNIVLVPYFFDGTNRIIILKKNKTPIHISSSIDQKEEALKESFASLVKDDFMMKEEFQSGAGTKSNFYTVQVSSSRKIGEGPVEQKSYSVVNIDEHGAVLAFESLQKLFNEQRYPELAQFLNQYVKKLHFHVLFCDQDSSTKQIGYFVPNAKIFQNIMVEGVQQKIDKTIDERLQENFGIFPKNDQSLRDGIEFILLEKKEKEYIKRYQIVNFSGKLDGHAFAKIKSNLFQKKSINDVWTLDDASYNVLLRDIRKLLENKPLEGTSTFVSAFIQEFDKSTKSISDRFEEWDKIKSEQEAAEARKIEAVEQKRREQEEKKAKLSIVPPLTLKKQEFLAEEQASSASTRQTVGKFEKQRREAYTPRVPGEIPREKSGGGDVARLTELLSPRKPSQKTSEGFRKPTKKIVSTREEKSEQVKEERAEIKGIPEIATKQPVSQMPPAEESKKIANVTGKIEQQAEEEVHEPTENKKPTVTLLPPEQSLSPVYIQKVVGPLIEHDLNPKKQLLSKSKEQELCVYDPILNRFKQEQKFVIAVPLEDLLQMLSEKQSGVTEIKEALKFGGSVELKYDDGTVIIIKVYKYYDILIALVAIKTTKKRMQLFPLAQKVLPYQEQPKPVVYIGLGERNTSEILCDEDVAIVPKEKLLEELKELLQFPEIITEQLNIEPELTEKLQTESDVPKQALIEKEQKTESKDEERGDQKKNQEVTSEPVPATTQPQTAYTESWSFATLWNDLLEWFVEGVKSIVSSIGEFFNIS